jgi:RNA polymerase-associated protein LEO1
MLDVAKFQSSMADIDPFATQAVELNEKDLFGDEEEEFEIEKEVENRNPRTLHGEDDQGKSAASYSATDLFGEDDDDDEGGVAEVETRDSVRDTLNRSSLDSSKFTFISIDDKSNSVYKYKEKQNPGSRSDRSVSNLCIPIYPRVSKSDEVLTTIRLPKIVATSKHLFDADKFDEEEEKQELAEVGKLANSREARMMHRKVVDGDGSERVETNTKIIEWSDGSRTLHIGSEVFSLQSVQGGATGGAASSAAASKSENVQLYTRATSMSTSRGHGSGEAGAGDAATTTTTTVLEANGVVSDRYLLRALKSVVSTTAVLDIRAGVVSTGGKASAGAKKQAGASARKIQQVTLLVDPEVDRQNRIKIEMEAARVKEMQKRGEEKALRDAARSAGARGVSDGYSKTGSPRGDDDGEEVSIKNIKNKRNADARTESSSGELATRGSKKPRATVDEEEESEFDDGEESDESSSSGSGSSSSGSVSGSESESD